MAVDPSGFSGGACGVPKSGPHPMTGVPSRTWSSPIAGTGVPLLVHSCIRRSRACLRLSWATASLLTAAAALASAWGRPDLLQSYRELCLLGSMGMLPKDVVLLVKELVQGD